MAANPKPSTKDQIREAAENDLEMFIKLVAPNRLLGDIHKEVIGWWTRQEAESHQLVLLPRAHQKSALIAYRVAWEITRNPAVSILYISATSNLAEKQLSAIKAVLTSPVYRKYWPEMVNKDEGKRERWSVKEIIVDHPKRKEEGTRDPTVFTAGLTTSITGLHCDVAVLDDIVAPDNAYTEEGRSKVAAAYSQLSSIENPGAEEWAVGTRYHPNDLYQKLMEMSEDTYDEEGEMVDSVPVYEVFQRVVETDGEFLWPRHKRDDGKYFGFNRQILAKKKAQYLDKTQFYAQYYNNPNNPENLRVGPEKFQYYDRKFVRQDNGRWYFKDKPLNVFAAIDFAFSRKKKADYTAVVVIGVDPDGNIYVLDIDRFKTDRISEYFEHIKHLYIKWGFRKLRAEVTVAQQAIVREMRDQYIKPNGLSLSIDEYRPSRHEGSKEERMAAVLEPRYDNLAIWHYRGGLCQALEEELLVENPPHDDIKDSLTAAIDVSTPPKDMRRRARNDNVVSFHSRFGGVC